MNEKCFGLYCGRTERNDSGYSDCGPCRRGYVVNMDGVCTKCTSSPLFYDWTYLAFVPVLSLGLHWFFIDYTNRKKTNHLLILHLSALLETIVACLCALLSVEPHGSLNLISCPVRQLSDWYTLFHNPKPDYVTEIHCTQEAVYPLYTIVFIYCAYALAFMMLLRPILSIKLAQRRGTKSIYAALYFYPIIVFLHAMLAGFIYYSFAYIVIVASVTTNAVHFSRIRQQTFMNLLKSHVMNARNLAILLCHWLAHAYGIIALTRLQEPVFHASLIALVPAPAIFYILTVKFTDPSKLKSIT